MKTHNSQPHCACRAGSFLKLSGASALGHDHCRVDPEHRRRPDAEAENVKANLKTLRLGEFNPNYATQWTYRLAQALGYLEDHGIEDLEVILSEEYMPGLIGGSLDITHGDTSEFFGSGNASGLPIKMISLHRDKEWWIMGTRRVSSRLKI